VTAIRDNAELFGRQHASLRAFYRLLAGASRDGRLYERDGITAALVPATPERSVCNGVVFDDAASLERALEPLASRFEDAGVRAWTVWVPAHDRDAAALLERHGHRLDASPAAMAIELAEFSSPPAPGLDLDPDPDLAEIGRLNDAAYGYEDQFTRALELLKRDSAYVYIARLDGEPAACTIALDHDRDCLIGLVATLPAARGRGLASALVTSALLDARTRGCETSSLQATRMGQPVYERIGYRDLGPIEMWERRR
jgi:GNAT superfamily N-acetyltransferase